jgi:ABC-type multidrug transport system fused ATPase/permease subunit
MQAFRAIAAGWYHGLLLAALPWVAALRPQWAPLLAAALVAGVLLAGRGRAAGPWPGAVCAASALIFLALRGGLLVGVGWLLLAAAVAALAWPGGRHGGSARLASALVGLAGWSIALLAVPDLVTSERGGWLAPAVLLLAARDAVVSAAWATAAAPGSLQPPSREARGTLSVRSLVVAGTDGLPSSVPLELELRAGDSVAVLYAAEGEAWALAETLAGRRRPAAGEVSIDGTPLEPGDRLVAVVAAGEPLVAGGLEDNLTALCEEHPGRSTISAVIEACGLDEVAEILDGAPISADGAPLELVHRLQLAVARVIPSDYRLLLVVDPLPWTDAQRREIWRRSVVRASVGRTAIWFTADRELAVRADRAMVLSHGSLRRLDSTLEVTSA